jgi:hypothetical protein
VGRTVLRPWQSDKTDEKAAESGQPGRR